MAARKSPSAPAQQVQDASAKVDQMPQTAANGNPPSRGAKGTPPVWKKRFFSTGSFVEVAVFRHVNGDPNPQGATHPTFSIALDRSYKDQEGRWVGTTYLRRDDLLVAAHALQRAYAWISEQDTRDA